MKFIAFFQNGCNNLYLLTTGINSESAWFTRWWTTIISLTILKHSMTNSLIQLLSDNKILNMAHTRNSLTTKLIVTPFHCRKISKTLRLRIGVTFELATEIYQSLICDLKYYRWGPHTKITCTRSFILRDAGDKIANTGTHWPFYGLHFYCATVYGALCTFETYPRELLYEYVMIAFRLLYFYCLNKLLI